MVRGAERDQQKLKYLNEADGPVFKIRNDPRLTGVGKFLSHSGLDELPQIFNILKGDMNLIGPRPLPVLEAKKIKKEFRVKRESIKPGVLSPWILNGYHRLSFDNWMESDVMYVDDKSFFFDLKIFLKSFLFLAKLFLKTIKETLTV